MKGIIKYFIFMCLLMVLLRSKAQDAQYSQPFINQLYTNGAFAGLKESQNFVLANRIQWMGVEQGYISNFVSAEFGDIRQGYHGKNKSIRLGLGFFYNRDDIVNVSLTNNQILFSPTVHWTAIQHNNRILVFSLSPLQPGFYNRQINPSDFLFNDQIITNSSTSISSQVLLLDPINRFDLASGGILTFAKSFVRHDLLFQGGYNVNHITPQNLSIIEDQSELLSPKHTFFTRVSWLPQSKTSSRAKRHLNQQNFGLQFYFLSKNQSSWKQREFNLSVMYSPENVGFNNADIRKIFLSTGLRNSEVFRQNTMESIIIGTGFQFGNAEGFTNNNRKSSRHKRHHDSIRMFEFSITYDTFGLNGISNSGGVIELGIRIPLFDYGCRECRLINNNLL